MEFQIDYGSFRPAPAPLYASVHGRASSLANSEVVFLDTDSGRYHVMTAQVLQAMDVCRPFRSLDDHVQRIIETLPQLKGQAAAVRRVVDGLVSRGLVRRADEFLAPFAVSQRPALAPLSAVFIRACDRPAQLSRLLDSLLDYERRHGARRHYVVIDDSTRADATREHARLLQQFADASGVLATHVDRTRWDAAVTRLCRALPQHAAVLRRLLTREADGIARGGGIGKNLITLLAAGSRYALLDDDFVFALRRHPDYRPGLRFDAGAWSPRSFVDNDAALTAGSRVDEDPIALQLDVCGAPLSAIANAVPGCELTPERLRGLAPSRVPTFDPNARVLATVNGHTGDAGASGIGWMYALDATARAAMTSSREAYLAALERPASWHGAQAFQVVKSANFTPFLVDNARLMPCTSALGRSEDALFAALAGAVHDDGVLMNVPFAVGHLQEGARDRRPLLEQPETPGVNLAIAGFVRDAGADLRGVDPAGRLRTVAARVRDLADGTDATLTSYLSEFLAYLRGSLIDALQRNLAAEKEPPVYWAADLRRVVENNGRALSDGSPPRFAGWPDDIDAAGCAARFRDELTQLADGLDAWPQAWDAAIADPGLGVMVR